MTDKNTQPRIDFDYLASVARKHRDIPGQREAREAFHAAFGPAFALVLLDLARQAQPREQAAIDPRKLLDIGGQMANVMFNLAQWAGEPLSARDAETMGRLRKEWDAARAALTRQAAPEARQITEETAQKYMEESLWAFIECAGNYPSINPDARIWPHVRVYMAAPEAPDSEQQVGAGEGSYMATKPYERLFATPAASQQAGDAVAWRFREYDDQEKQHSSVWQVTTDPAAIKVYERYNAIVEPLGVIAPQAATTASARVTREGSIITAEWDGQPGSGGGDYSQPCAKRGTGLCACGGGQCGLERERATTASASDACAEMRALCSACGGTGDVHSIDGEWRGICDCEASAWSRAPAQQTERMQPSREAAPLDADTVERWMNGIGGGVWNDGKLTLSSAELKAVIHGIASLAVKRAALTQQSAAQAPDLLDAAVETLKMHDEVTGGLDYGYISPNLRPAVNAAQAAHAGANFENLKQQIAEKIGEGNSITIHGRAAMSSATEAKEQK